MMEDFERGWYWSLILESVYSPLPGYLKLDSDLWRLAGARSAQFFSAKNAGVLACFKRREIEGQEWIYSERLVETLKEQGSKLERHIKKRAEPSYSYSQDFSKKNQGLSVCNTCDGEGLIHQKASVAGPRLIPCPKCSQKSPKSGTKLTER